MKDDISRYRLGFDIGGTFTDFVMVDVFEGQIHLHKCLTTPKDPSIGALEGMLELLERVDVKLNEIGHLVHGTTLVTNTIIERCGSKVGYLTTEGFRDILQMGTEQRYDIHDLFLKFPDPLAPRQWRREIKERITRDGDIIIPLDLDQAAKEIDRLANDNIEAIAICLLHAYKNPTHEIALRDFIAQEYPNIAVSISSEVHPELKEYQRASTTTANAYVQPLMSDYVYKLQKVVSERGFAGRFHLMQSSGGLTAPETSIRFPVRFLESGPAGGAEATAFVGDSVGHKDIISFDMGGTTAKACLIQNGRPDITSMLEAGRVHRFKRGSGIPIHAPVIDMIEIGAGGGSIAHVDNLGLLKIGPKSAGAAPGPACYAQGGIDPTVTDANVLLGYLDPDYFLGGRMSLDIDAAKQAMNKVAIPLNLDILQAAAGIIDVVAENMAGAARVHIVEKGCDPRRYAMVAMGGAGPLHASHVARKLGVSEVVIPPASGAASALGFLAASIGYETSRSMPTALSTADFEIINDLLDSLEKDCRKQLIEAGGGSSNVIVERLAEMRLRGQMHEITIVLPEGRITANSIIELTHRFSEEYTRLFTHLYEDAQMEIINWRVRCTGPEPELSTRLGKTNIEKPPLKGHRSIYSHEKHGLVKAPVYDRYSLTSGTEIAGPAIIEERESTTILMGGDQAVVDNELNLRLTINLERSGDVVVASDTAFDEAIQRIESDPIGLEIMWSRLINIAEESWHTVIRTAFSLIIGEAQDFACEILDAKGKQIVHSPRAMPVFNLTLPIAVNAMIEHHPIQTLKEGDVLITNDPWLCAGHLFDIAVAVPVFREGRIVAFVGIVGHVSDVGGIKDELNAREIYDEGLQIPPMKLFRAGEPNEDLFTIIKENVRQSDQVLGDIHALVAAGVTGAERIKEFMDDYGMHDLEALAHVVQNRAEIAMRKAVAELPDGTYKNVLDSDGIDEVMTFPIQITVNSDQISVNFEGAPDQTERGGSNCTLSYTRAHATYPLKCIFTPDVPGNAGCYRPMEINAPEKSILNCERPKAVNTRVRTGWYVAPNIFAALSKAAPDRVQAFTGLPSSALFYGIDSCGEVYSDHLFQGGGQGASSRGDGISGLLYPTSAANTSVELFETRVPALVLQKAYVPNTGGPGKKRGGLSQQLSVRKLHNDNLACQVNLHPNGVKTALDGLFGGKAGGRAKAWIEKGNGEIEDLGVGGSVQLTDANHQANLLLPGGSGYGDPWSRDYDAIQRDLDEEMVSPKAACRDYGCVLDEDNVIDRAASNDLRANATASSN